MHCVERIKLCDLFYLFSLAWSWPIPLWPHQELLVMSQHFLLVYFCSNITRSSGSAVAFYKPVFTTLIFVFWIVLISFFILRYKASALQYCVSGVYQWPRARTYELHSGIKLQFALQQPLIFHGLYQICIKIDKQGWCWCWCSLSKS